MKLKFKKLHPNAKLPVYATKQAAGMDVFACLDAPIVLQEGEAAAISTGFAMELPFGYEAQFRGRSGLAFKHAVFSFNGTIDSDYRGEVKGLLINHSRVPFTIEPGMRIGQMIVNIGVVRCYPEFSDELETTERGEGGFGSTGLAGIQAREHTLTDENIEEAISEIDKAVESRAEVLKKQPSFVRYHESMGDQPLSNEEIMEQLLNVGKNK